MAADSDTPPTGTAIPRPRPPKREPLPPPVVKDVVPTAPLPPAELDIETRRRLADAIARVMAAELGSVRISSVPPPADSEPPPRSSMRVAAKYTGKGIKWGAILSGAVSFAASMIVWVAKPEYAAPLAQALKLIAGVIIAAMGGGPPEPPAPALP